MFLDRAAPGWDRLIDLRVLDIGSNDQCVLGQLGRRLDRDQRDRQFVYLVAADAYGLDLPRMLAYGLTGELDELPLLTAAWILLISGRREVHVHHVDRDDDLIVLARIDECDSGIGGMVLRLRDVITGEETTELATDLVVSR